MRGLTRRTWLRGVGAAAFGGPLLARLFERDAFAAGRATRVIFYYFPDGVAGPSQDGEPTLWHATGSEHTFALSPQLEPLERHRSECLFFNGLSMGATDSGSHPGGAKKLLTAVDGGQGESIDQVLARTAGASAPFRHLYLGAMANANNASGDKHISYPSAGQSIAPEDDPLRAFERLFGSAAPAPPGSPPPGGSPPGPMRDPRVTVLDRVIGEVDALRTRLGQVERRKLELHLESLREVEARIKAAAMNGGGSGSMGGTGAMCRPGAPSIPAGELGRPERFPEILRLQLELTVEAMACGLTQVAVIQGSHHTSDLIMSRFMGTEMYDPAFDMRSHQASHYGARHDYAHREFRDYVAQRRWWVEQFAYLLDLLRARPEGDGSMLDNSVVLLVTEVCDGNTHLHDNMPFVLAGRAGGAISPGRLLQLGHARHGDLLAAIAHAMGQPFSGFGDASSGPLPGVLT